MAKTIVQLVAERNRLERKVLAAARSWGNGRLNVLLFHDIADRLVATDKALADAERKARREIAKMAKKETTLCR